MSATVDTQTFSVICEAVELKMCQLQRRS